MMRMVQHEKGRKRARAQQWYEARVRCSGQIHRLQWTPRGAIRMLNHSKKDLKALRTLKALGDSTCGCLTTLDTVRQKYAEWPMTTRAVRKEWTVPFSAGRSAREDRHRANDSRGDVGSAWLEDGLRVADPKASATEAAEYWRHVRKRRAEELRGEVEKALVGVRPFKMQALHVQVIRTRGRQQPVAYYAATLTGNFERTAFTVSSVHACVSVPLRWLRLRSLGLTNLGSHGLVLDLLHFEPGIPQRAEVLVARLERIAPRGTLRDVPEAFRDVVGYAVLPRRARVQRAAAATDTGFDKWSIVEWLDD